jgi:restriction endonuclease S subunit
MQIAAAPWFSGPARVSTSAAVAAASCIGLRVDRQKVLPNYLMLYLRAAYLSYLFRTAVYMQEVNQFSRGIVADRNRLYWESFKQMPSLVPGIEDQDKIVAYLRAQDAHIA